MPVSRPILIALAAALLALVAFAASSTMRGGEESSAPAPKQTQAPAPKPTKPDAAKSAQAPRTQQAKASEPASARTDGKPTQRTAAGEETEAAVAARVQRAVDRGRTVVLFFYQRGGADDSATAESVASLRGRRGVAIFTAPVSRLGDFRAVTGSLGISQAPAVVIVGKQGKDRKARVVEGFIDSQTLAQEVADVR